MLKKIWFLLFFGCGIAFSQVKISGTIIDAKSNKAVPYADIKFPQSNKVTTSNTDGSFYLESPLDEFLLEINAFGYETQQEKLKEKINYKYKINLKPYPKKKKPYIIELDEVIARKKKIKKYADKKENPAYAILKELWKRKHKNGLKIVPQYQYEEYEKLQFDLNNIDSTFIKNKLLFKDFEFIFNRIDTSKINGKAYLPAFINESIYKVYGRNKPSEKERKDLIANKSSGFDDNEIVSKTVKGLYRKFDVYDNRINFFDKNFVSPVARDGFSVYEYTLSDTINIDGIDCYRIKYTPKRQGEYTFMGDVYISLNTYSVKEVSMHSTKDVDVNFVKDIFVSLEYEVKNDSIFYPKKDYILLDMSILNKKSGSKGMFAHRTSTYKDFNFTESRTDKFYDDRSYDAVAAGAYEKSNEFWKNARHDSLSKQEEGIYETLDSLKKVPRFKRIVNLVKIIGSGYINVWNSIDIGDLYSTFGYNKIEGIRLRAGARTFFTPNDRWRVEGYLAYGFNDDQFKYGAEARYMFNRINRFTLGIGKKRDIEQLGAQIMDSDKIMNRTFGSSSILVQGGNNVFLSHIDRFIFYGAIDPWENFTVRLDANIQNIRSADSSFFDIGYNYNGKDYDRVIDSHLTFSIISRPGAKFSQTGVDRYEHSNNAPTFSLRYLKGLKGVLNSDFNYDKIQFMYIQPILIGSFGKSNISVEAGKTFQAVPISLLSIIPGNQSYGQIPGTFSQLNFYEFVTDSYATFILDHHFNGFFFNRIPWVKKLNLREVGFFRTAWGSISERSQKMNQSTVTYLAPENQAYVEYGVGVENIGFGNLRILRIDFNWRGNYLNSPNARPFGITAGLKLNF